VHSYCTYFNHNYLSIGLALIDSMKQHCQPYKLYILCLDEKCYQFFSHNKSESTIIPISTQKLEAWNPQLLNAKSNRSEIEYFWTCTPCILYFIIEKFKEAEITYLDADQFFFNSPNPVFEQIKNSSVAIMPHRFPNYLQKLDIHGKYNVSWLTFKDTKDSIECLQWWMEECIKWCYYRVENDKYGDQKYLDQFEEKFNGVHIIDHTGCGMAPWNSHIQVLPENQILYHFQSFRIRKNYLFEVQHRVFSFQMSKELQQRIFLPYMNKIREIRKMLHSLNHLPKEVNKLWADLEDILQGEFLICIFKRSFRLDLYPIFFPILSFKNKVLRKFFNVTQ